MDDLRDKLTENVKKWWKVFVFVGPILSVFLGGIYLEGYWSFFEVYYLDYMSVGEIVSRSVFNVVGVCITCVFVAAFLFVISGKMEKLWPSGAGRSDGAKKKGLGRWIDNNKEFSCLIFSFIMIIFVGGGVFYDQGVGRNPITQFVLIGLGCAVAAYSVILLPMYFKNVRLDPFVLWVIALFIGLIPMFCYVRGWAVGINTRFESDPVDFKYELVVESGDQFKKMPDDAIYIGRMGGYVFLTSKLRGGSIAIPEGRIIMIRTKDKNDSKRIEGK